MSHFNNFISELKQEITGSLKNSSKSYYSVGINLFHSLRTKTYLEFQPAVGNLCIAVELLLKAIVAQKAFRYLYTNIPIEVQLMLTNPEALDNSFNPRKFSADLKTFKYNTIELHQAISLFYQFYPQKKQEYKPYFSLLSFVRNVSVHGALPPFQRYELDRIAYISTKIFAFASESKIFDYFYVLFDEKTKQFMKAYDAERIERVKKAIEDAKSKSKKIDHYGSFILSSDELEYMVIQCPICGSDAFINGYTDEDTDPEHGIFLTFFADSFQCEECGLKLLDSKELELAGIETVYDRTDEIGNSYHGYEE